MNSKETYIETLATLISQGCAGDEAALRAASELKALALHLQRSLTWLTLSMHNVLVQTYCENPARPNDVAELFVINGGKK